jgi:outer membrane receptor protein involved in Fe transport
MKSIIFPLAIFILFYQYVQAQDFQRMLERYDQMPVRGKITGKVIDSQSGQPLEYATIALFIRDTILLTGTTTNPAGEFSMDVKMFTTYSLRTDYIGYKQKWIRNVSVSENNSNINVGPIQVETAALDIGEVQITGERGQVQLSLDKKVYNVERDITSQGGSAAEVLQNVPSVTVDMDGAVSVRGSGNVRILVDGKPSGLTGISKADVLEQIPASTIESIEVITNPSARYDSESMGGIINIILKKQKQPGLNGLFNITAGTGNRYNSSIHLNSNRGWVNIFGGYDVRYNERKRSATQSRYTRIMDSIAYMDQERFGVQKNLSHSFRAGSDFNLNNRNTITVSGRYRLGDESGNTELNFFTYDENRILTDYYKRFSDETEDEWDYDLNLSYRRSYENKRKSLTTDIVFSEGYELDNNMITGQPYDLAFQPIGDGLFETTRDLQLQKNLSAQIDYVHPVGKEAKIETGAKTNWRFIDADFVRMLEDPLSDVIFTDTNASNQFIYDDMVHAAYVSYGNKIGKHGFMAGLRAEQSLTFIDLKNGQAQIENDYIDFFPSAFLSRELGDEQTVQLSYTRRINRPRYRALIPSSDFSDPLNLRTGNPNLKPEYTNAFELGYLRYIKNITLNSTLYFRRTTDVITRFRTLRPDGVSVLTFENLAISEDYGAELVLSGQLLKWLRINASGNIFRNQTEAPNLGQELSSDYLGYFARLGVNLALPYKTDMQIMSHYRGPRESPTGRMLEMFFMDIGAKKEIFKNKGTVTLRVSDPFNTGKFRYETFGPGFQINGSFDRNMQAVYLGFSYRINNFKQERERNRGDQGQMDDSDVY